MKKFIFLLIFISCIGLVACNNKGLVYADNLLDNQKVINKRKLVDYGYDKNGDLIFNYKIGEIKDAFVGYLTESQYYDGNGVSQITYSKGSASKEIAEWSIKNISILTNGAEYEQELTIGYMDFASLSLKLGFNIEEKEINEQSFGKTYENMIYDLNTKTFSITSKSGKGYYSIAALTDYTVYQSIVYEMDTQTIKNNTISFLESSYITDTSFYLVKADEKEGFKNVFEKISDNINIIRNISDEDLKNVINNLKTNISSKYNFIYGDDITLSNGSYSDWTAYKKVDCLTNIILNHENFNLLKNIYKTMKIKVKFDCEEKAKEKINLKFKLVNQSNGEQFGEQIVDLSACEYVYSIDLSKVNSDDILDIEYSFILHNITFDKQYILYRNREYTIEFE